jgi:hypothetical protein
MVTTYFWFDLLNFVCIVFHLHYIREVPAFRLYKGKGKIVPLQALSGLEGG